MYKVYDPTLVCMVVLFRKLLIFLITLFIFITTVIFWNKYQLECSNNEIKLLENEFGDIRIRDELDIYRLSNLVTSKIKNNQLDCFPLEVKKILDKKKGSCYERSFILQKFFIYNRIPIRPVYLYFLNHKTVSILDIFDKRLFSHNMFEFYYNGKWFVMKTNSAYNKLITLDDYIKFGSIVPVNTKFVRYLNNRNGKFIYPFWLPDIYFFN